MNNSREHNIYTEYYLNQAGCGFSAVYSGPIFQKGYGIGSFLGGLFRCAFPILKKTSSVVGAEILKSGCNVLSDVSRNENVKNSIKKRGKETINNLSKIVGDKMFGAGYNNASSKRSGHSVANTTTVKKRKITTKNKTKKTAKSKGEKKPKTKPKKKSNSSKKSTRCKEEVFDIFS